MATEPRIIGESADPPSEDAVAGTGTAGSRAGAPPPEIGGRDGPDPTRFGDWEKNGRCIDF